MRKLVKLTLFFSLSFIILFLAATGIRYLFLRVEWAQQIPQMPQTFLFFTVSAARWALSFTLFSSVLLSLSYTVRKRIFMPAAAFFIIFLSVVFNTGLSYGLHHIGAVSTSFTNEINLGENGVVVSNTLNSTEPATILLNGLADPYGPRVQFIPDRPLIYQESAPVYGVSLPPVPFGSNVPWFIGSLFNDIKLSSDHLLGRFNAGLFPYLIYTGALIIFLTSLGFIFKISVWSLASLFVGISVFRGIIAVESFFNSLETQEMFGSFFGGAIPGSLTVPLVFIGFSLLFNIYSLLVFAAGKRGSDGN